VTVGGVVSAPPEGVASTVKLSKRLLPPVPPPAAVNSTFNLKFGLLEAPEQLKNQK
jgi:hypothetical protein